MVHLQAVRLRGFKTFARPTELTFEPGVTVIIGPNGSGKSNIADAVLWVLGEQSPANLRGQNMQDVMFSGAGGRKASAVTEVSLVFDNRSGSLPLDRSELEVTRRLVRDTGSEYRLNGSECRLLDIQDVVGALGLGREMHSVISQGKVEALLNSSPEVRRAMVEEAAGLGRFKKRRERAQSKLEKTGQNLLRVADIEREVKSALRPLRQQVVAAERFAEATEEWALASARAVLHALVGAREAQGKAEEDIRCLQGELSAVSEKISDLRRQRAAEEEQFTKALEERERLSNTYHRVRAEADYLEGRTVSLRQRLARIEGDLDRSKRRRELARSEAAALESRVQELAGETADEVRLARVGAWGEALRQALEQALPEYRSEVAAEDDLKDSVFELEASRSRALQDREFLRREISERARVAEELAVLVTETQGRSDQLGAEAARLDQEIVATTEALRKAESEVKRAAADRDEARARVEEATREEVVTAERLAGLESRRTVLGEVLARKEAMPAGAHELVEAYPGCRPLFEVLRVEPGFERAVAAALGPLVHAVVVPGSLDLASTHEVHGAFEAVQEASRESPEEPGETAPAGTRDLWEVVSGPATVLGQLRRLVPPSAVVVEEDRSLEDVDDGASDSGGASWRLVTRSGGLLQAGVHSARRSEVGAETLLAATNELESVSRESATLEVRRREAREAAEQAAQEVARAESAYRQREQELHETERRLAAQKNEQDLQERRIAEACSQLDELETRQQRESGAAEQLGADLGAVEAALTEGETRLDEARSALRALQVRLETARRTVSRLEEKKGQAGLVEVKLRERCRAHGNERTRVQGQFETATRESDRCERRVGFLERYAPVIGALLQVSERLAEHSRSAATRLENDVESTRTQTEGTARVMRDRGSAETDLQREHETSSLHLTQARVDQARFVERATQLEEELAELRRRHLSPRSLVPEDVSGEDAEALAAAVERAERRKERIGPVNPLAEQECSEMEERARFLAEQRGDLEASLGQLQEVITELDEHIERSFSAIFESARERFSAVIASVFPGAKGSLRLTEPKVAAKAARAEGEDLDDEADDDQRLRQPAGISIEVKLPNKSPRSLSLLSGGEKAMTAIAFLFALFLARPCPFYILDEVEASLDDINIRRFLSLIHKYRDRTQFIIITHQRQTMEVADTLYGVALESDGTSRVLSRRLATAKGA